ncbi:MAG: hypothetical protein ACD_15C00111G0014 [uncultured bacterium]|nr:MAG: hypothetical protein ACD_15C00111G0014 [uncultured bacterium]
MGMISQYEIIVSDVSTEEDTELMMQEFFPEVVFLPSKENIGFSGAVNKGLEAAKGEYILILNGDIVVKKEAISILLDYIKKNPEVGIVAPQLLNFNETYQPSTFRFYTPLTILYRRTFLGKLPFAKNHLDNFLMKNFDHQSIMEVDWIMGSSFMIKKEIADKVGLMDTKFRMYFEDTDWCRRFWEAGYKVVYLPMAQMYHYHGRGSAGKGIITTLLFNRLAWIHIASALRYFRKYAGRPLPKHK